MRTKIQLRTQELYILMSGLWINRNNFNLNLESYFRQKNKSNLIILRHNYFELNFNRQQKKIKQNSKKINECALNLNK